MSKVDPNSVLHSYLPAGKSRIPKGMRPPASAVKKSPDNLAKLKNKDYKVSLSDQAKDLKKDIASKQDSSSSSASSSASSGDVPTTSLPEVDPGKELAKEALKNEAQKLSKVDEKQYWVKDEPAIIFISGFEMFDSSSASGDYDGIPEMGKAIKHAKHFTWDQEEEILEHIKTHRPHTPLILVGHSFGGDTAVEIAREINKPDYKFRSVDLMVTLDSVGYDNDAISENVRINLNYMADDVLGLLNDGPNFAQDYEKTFVQNLLRGDGHTKLDDAPDIQKTIMDAIERLT